MSKHSPFVLQSLVISLTLLCVDVSSRLCIIAAVLWAGLLLYLPPSPCRLVM